MRECNLSMGENKMSNNQATCSAFDVAKYIIPKMLSKFGKLTTIKLQKLLYYSQAWYLVFNNEEE